MRPLKYRSSFPAAEGWFTIENTTQAPLQFYIEPWAAGFTLNLGETAMVHIQPDHGYPPNLQFWQHEGEHGLSIFCADAVYGKDGKEWLDLMDDDEQEERSENT